MAIRADSVGLFWEDIVPEKAPKAEKIKRTPPERVWERDDYLPDLNAAEMFFPVLYQDWELAGIREPLVFDSEIYPNYVLLAFRGLESKKAIYFEMDNEPLGNSIHLGKLLWVLQNNCIINFNGRRFDFVIAALILHGCTTEQLWKATQMLIEFKMRPQHVLRHFGATKLGKINQIDLIDLTALSPGLKVCAGRLHAKRMQDLPFVPGKYLTPDQIKILFMYCFNDLDNTELLYRSLLEQIAIREDTGKIYGLDLRSHSDPQMAEAIINSELKRIARRKFFKPTQLPEGTTYRYIPPAFIQFQTPMMNAVLDKIRNAVFPVADEETGGEFGTIIMPKELLVPVVIANCTYQMGIGGLHSKEKRLCQTADENYFIADTDVTSYYPRLIINAGLYPETLGPDFIKVFSAIVDQRVAAKKAGNSVVAECLKIVVNGTFGKLGSMHSIMYAPNLMIQVTITGQLSLLMLIEAFELAGIEVLSANTDGVVVKCHKDKEALFNAIVKAWQKHTGFDTEEVRYKGVYGRDVNNYFAVYEKPQKKKLFKLKGVYGETAPKKNAVNEICIDAATAFIATGADIATTIRTCKRPQKFTTMRRVKGGGVKVWGKVDAPAHASKEELIAMAGFYPVEGVGNYRHAQYGEELAVFNLDNAYAEALRMLERPTRCEYLGKIIRWYYSTEAQGEIVSGESGNKVARTDNAAPCMTLPDELPPDLDFAWYEAETRKILEDIGYLQPVTQ